MKLRASLGVGLGAHSPTDRKEGGDHQGMTVVCIAMGGGCAQGCPPLCDPMDCLAHQAPLFMGFSRQQYLSGLPLPPPGDLPGPGIEPVTLAPPALAGGLFTWKIPLGATLKGPKTLSTSPAHAKQAS